MFCCLRLAGQSDTSTAPPSEPCHDTEYRGDAGRIDIILGPMFAGKTSELLRRVEDHEVGTTLIRVTSICFRIASSHMASIPVGPSIFQRVSAGCWTESGFGEVKH